MYMYTKDIQTTKTDAYNLSCQSNKNMGLHLTSRDSFSLYNCAYDVSK